MTKQLSYREISELPKPHTGSARVLCNCPACLNGWREIAELIRREDKQQQRRVAKAGNA